MMRVCLLALPVVLLAAAGAAPAEEVLTVGSRTYLLDNGTWWLVAGGEAWEVLNNQVVIETESTLSESSVDTLLNEIGLDVAYRADWGPYCHLSVPDTTSAVGAAARCLSIDGVADAWADTKVSLAAAPSDSFYALRLATGDANNTTPWWHQWNLSVIDADAAWDIEVGDTAVVLAMLDSGIQLDHDDLRGNLWVNWDEHAGYGAFDDDGNGYDDDIYGLNVDDESGDVGGDARHGVWVAGLMSAQTSNDETGTAGLAGGWYEQVQWSPGTRGSGCQIMTLASPSLSTANLATGLVYAAEMGADVANMSFSYASSTPEWARALDIAATEGMVLVAATDNHSSDTLRFPAKDEDVIAVGAVDFRGYRAWYSNYGPELDVVAPSGACSLWENRCGDLTEAGSCPEKFKRDSSDDQYMYESGSEHCIYDSLFLWSTGDYPAEDGYGYFSGTSGAAPQVAALAGLLKSYDSSLTRTEIKSLICDSAEDLIGDNEDTRGWDDEYGHGRINAYAALFLARGGGATTSNLRLCYDVEFDRDVKISSGDTLTILPDVEITFASGSDAANLGIDSNRCELIVEGALIAVDSSGTLPITFTTTADSAGAWYGIRAPADTGTINLDNCVIENARKGLSVDNPDELDAGDLTINDCVTHGIFLDNCGSGVVVGGSTITDPGTIGIEARDCSGIALSNHNITNATAYGIKATGASSLTISDNSILGSATGSEVVGIRCGGADTTSTFTISGNTIERCGYQGMYIRYGAEDSALITGNCISDTSYTRGGTGIYFSYSSAKLRWTTIEAKTHGVVAMCGEFGSPSPFWIPDLGDTTDSDGNNRLLDNSLYFVWSLGQGRTAIKAEHNWFDGEPPAQKFYGNVDRDPCLGDDPGTGGRAVSSGDLGEDRWRLELEQNRPNPFNPTTTIEYSIWAPGRVTLRVYNMAGKLVRTLVNQMQEPGYHDVVWDGSDDHGRQVAGGVYFARMVSGGETKMRKLILLK